MRAALTEAKNAGKSIELDVDSENPPALNLKNDPRTLVC